MNPDEQNQTSAQTPKSSEQLQPAVQYQPPIIAGGLPASQASPPAPAKRTFKQKLRRLLASKKFWLLVISLLVAASAAAWFIPPSRLWLVNLAGGKNTLTITTIAPGEGKAKPAQLRNVSVTVNGQTYKTDVKGMVRVKDLPYGAVLVSAKKTGYKDVSHSAKLDFDPFFYIFGGKAEFDSARSATLSMTAVGIPVSFKAIDWLSGQPVTSGQFTIGDVAAKPDDQGIVRLKIPGSNDSKVSISTSFGGKYIDKKFELTLGSQDTPGVTFVPGGKHYFISKRSGVLTVYGSDLDGSNVQPIVTGTGQEISDIAFALSPDGKRGVLASSRDGDLNARKDPLQRVYVVDLGTKQLTRVDQGVNVSFADWSGDTLVYTTTAYDSSSNTYKTTLRSVDAGSNRVYNFETTDYISVSTVAFDRVIYQKYDYSQPGSSPLLRQATITGTSAKTLGEQTSYDSYIQLDFDRIVFKTMADQAWHEYNMNTDQLKTIPQPTTGNNTQQFLSTANADGSKRIMIDRIDGKYTLIVKGSATGEQKSLYGADGLGGPIRWLGDNIVFRVVTESETADYIVSLGGGQPKKITDVTATASTQGARVDQRFRFY